MRFLPPPSPPPHRGCAEKRYCKYVCEISKCQDMLGLGRPKPNSPDAKLKVPDTIDPNPKTNLLMTICLSHISFQRACCPVTSATPPFYVRNQDSNAPRPIIQA